MKKWQEFLLWFVCFSFIDVTFEFIKTLAESGTLSKWTFALVALVMLVVGWIAVFIGAKALKNKKEEKRNIWIARFIYFVIVWSVCITFGVMRYSLENSILNTWYFSGIGSVLFFIGLATGYLGNILPKQKKKRN